jgi:hypothetical protein
MESHSRLPPVVVIWLTALLPPFSSDAWRIWNGAKAWKIDAVRAFCRLFLGPAFVVFLFLVAYAYQSAIYVMEEKLAKMATQRTETPEALGLLDRITKIRNELLWSQSPASFVTSVVKSASASIPLLRPVTIYVLNTLAGPNGWVDVFIPKAVADFAEAFLCKRAVHNQRKELSTTGRWYECFSGDSCCYFRA